MSIRTVVDEVWRILSKMTPSEGSVYAGISTMICNRLGIEHEKAFKNSAAYIQSWLKALKNDNKMIVWAAKKAEEAARYILGEKPAE